MSDTTELPPRTRHPLFFADLKIFLVHTHGYHLTSCATHATQVENTLFKVPAHLLIQHSAVFADMSALTMSDGTSNPDEGDCENQPIEIPGESATTFEDVLGWIYAQYVHFL